jgi:hypothetical protein
MVMDKFEIRVFCDFVQRRMVASYLRGGTIYRSRLRGSRGPIGCPETSARNYHSTLREIAKEHRSHLRLGGSLKSRIEKICLHETAGISSYCPASQQPVGRKVQKVMNQC